jgi:GDP-4-dehydro-6-deoxy-D-mannose reductase
VRVLVTGTTGFVGRWLTEELRSYGHAVLRTPPSRELDITDHAAVMELVRAVAPDAIAHLAAVSFAGDARTDPARAFAVNVGGTAAVMEAAGRQPRPPVVLVTGSSEAYGPPRSEDLPLGEGAPLLAESPYGLSKLAEEAVALELANARGIPLVIARPFNHTGPGQRADFVVPALVGRIGEVLAGRAATVRIGNAEVRRDFLDVRDVTRAYRLLLEAAARGVVASTPAVVNVASGRSVSVRWIAETLMGFAGCQSDLVVDSDLLRIGDPPEIVGDSSRLSALTGWLATIPFEQTLREMASDASRRAGSGGRPSW